RHEQWEPLRLHCSHRFRIKSTAGAVLADGAGVAVDRAGAEPLAAADAEGRRADDGGGASVVAGAATTLGGVAAGALALPFVLVPAAGGARVGLAVDVSEAGMSSVRGGGGGMSRAGPVVGSKVGVPDASVVAALASELEGMVRPVLAGPETAAATSTPPSDMT